MYEGFHSYYIQQWVFDAAKVRRLIWCPNSPDLNAIEPAWLYRYLKRATTNLGGLPNRKTAIEKWTEEWAKMPQEKVQAWIDRIPRHIQEVIRLEGGNEYKEGQRDPS
jgi:hypothetical protein